MSVFVLGIAVLIFVTSFIYNQLQESPFDIPGYSAKVVDTPAYNQLRNQVYELDEKGASRNLSGGAIFVVESFGMSGPWRTVFVLFSDSRVVATDPESPTGFSTWSVDAQDMAKLKKMMGEVERLSKVDYFQNVVSDQGITQMTIFDGDCTRSIRINGEFMIRYNLRAALNGAVSVPECVRNLYGCTCTLPRTAKSTWPRENQRLK